MPIELLAPAKNLECGIEAIKHGADAVYIGAPKYGARAAAGNSIDDLRQLAEYAHQFGAKVYVTLNTIIYDEELAEVESLVWELYHIGIDALIVQDMALLTMKLPPVEL
ncbi:MAG: collagenase-like protease, partial [Bacteroidaceae bacterium]|nr:collagenase-like protease [Bacteroidaceae bacterium]